VAYRRSNQTHDDRLWKSQRSEKHPQSQQGVCADAIATLEGIDREAADGLAVKSQENTAKVFKEGRFYRALFPF